MKTGFLHQESPVTVFKCLGTGVNTTQNRRSSNDTLNASQKKRDPYFPQTTAALQDATISPIFFHDSLLDAQPAFFLGARIMRHIQPLWQRQETEESLLPRYNDASSAAQSTLRAYCPFLGADIIRFLCRYR
ncbi:hypothetical protein ZHAS_00003792 [Anopheles sinensis]|uniref:Uncharacterized protein n=1 Tax=Anopheles sinensis TaxID=74873 RepID=A0A084VF52_ANOSI|nr:hypothetical protein ZHAS_00003792 [Anopheles sinensis]